MQPKLALSHGLAGTHERIPAYNLAFSNPNRQRGDIYHDSFQDGWRRLVTGARRKALDAPAP